MKRTATYTSSMHISIRYYVYEPEVVLRIKGIVQIHHGLGEHADRYEHFASFLAARGFVVVVSDFAEVLKKELPSLTRFENSKIEIKEISDIIKKEVKIEEVSIIVPSLRLDNIVSDLVKTSRSKAKQIIEQERVFVNGQNETKMAKQVKIGNIITIRGKGRFIVKEQTGTTRSGRAVLKIEKYV